MPVKPNTSNDLSKIGSIEELILLAKQDQKDIIASFSKLETVKGQALKDKILLQTAKAAHLRAKRMEILLNSIKSVRVDEIGQDASEAILLLAQHSYLRLMKKVAKLFLREFKKYKESVPATYIPSLLDRISIIENGYQLFGTQWIPDSKGEPFLIYVKDFDTVNARRSEFGLGPIMKPHNLANHTHPYPLGKGEAVISDMRKPSKKDLANYSKFYTKPLI